MTSTATRASCEALCASIGSPATSPIAKMFGSPVRRCSSVSMNPFAATLTLVVSRPGIFEFGRRPTATSTRSNIDRKSTRLNSKSRLHLVCRLLLEKKKKKTNENHHIDHRNEQHI